MGMQLHMNAGQRMILTTHMGTTRTGQLANVPGRLTQFPQYPRELYQAFSGIGTDCNALRSALRHTPDTAVRSRVDAHAQHMHAQSGQALSALTVWMSRRKRTALRTDVLLQTLHTARLDLVAGYLEVHGLAQGHQALATLNLGPGFDDAAIDLVSLPPILTRSGRRHLPYDRVLYSALTCAQAVACGGVTPFHDEDTLFRTVFGAPRQQGRQAKRAVHTVENFFRQHHPTRLALWEQAVAQSLGHIERSHHA